MGDENRMEQLISITEKTAIPISLVIAIIGAAIYISDIHAHVDEIINQQSEYRETLKHIDQRLSRIEGKLGVNLGSENKVQTTSVSTLPSTI